MVRQAVANPEKNIILKRISKVSELKENHEMLEKDANAKIDAATASSGLGRTMVIVILVKMITRAKYQIII